VDLFGVFDPERAEPVPTRVRRGRRLPPFALPALWFLAAVAGCTVAAVAGFTHGARSAAEHAFFANTIFAIFPVAGWAIVVAAAYTMVAVGCIVALTMIGYVVRGRRTAPGDRRVRVR
jgi:uncharacterized membrane protein